MKLLPFARSATPHSPQENEIKSPQRGNIAGNELTICCTWCRIRNWPGDPNFIELNPDYTWIPSRKPKAKLDSSPAAAGSRGVDTSMGGVLPIEDKPTFRSSEGITESFGGNRKTAKSIPKGSPVAKGKAKAKAKAKAEREARTQICYW